MNLSNSNDLSPPTVAAARRSGFGFTVIEMLVVLAIIGILASMTLPALKGLGEGNIMASANRQMLDAVAEARLLAIKERTKVFLVFAGPINPAWTVRPELQSGLLTRQYKAYAMFAERTAGDQPGRENHHPRYLRDWEELPDGVMVAPWKFADPFVPPVSPLPLPTVIGFDYKLFPYPDVGDALEIPMAYIAFGPQGGVVSSVSTEGTVIIPLARGDYFLQTQPSGALTWEAATPTEQPALNSINNRNYIVVDALTGRARVDRPQIRP